MLRQALVEKGVVRPDQIEHAAILAHHAVDEELGLLPKRLTEVVVEVRDTGARSGRPTSRLRSRSHCPAKLVARLNERGSASILRDLLLEHAPAGGALPRIAASSSSSSGMLLQRKNDRRDASSRSLMR